MVCLAKDLTELIQKFGPALADSAESVLNPRYVPGVSKVVDVREVEFNRTRRQGKKFRFFPAQIHKIGGMCEGLKSDGRSLFIAEMGCGKSPMSLAVAHVVLKKKKNWRAIVLCPGHIVRKWRREVEWAIPNVYVKAVRNFADLMDFKEKALKHTGPSIMVISKESAKLGFDVDRPTAAKRRINTSIATKVGGQDYLERVTMDVAACPTCGQIQMEEVGDYKNPIAHEDYLNSATPVHCPNCREKLSTNARGHRRNPHVDRYIQRKMRGFFDLLIADEVHELAGADTIQGNTFGTLAASCRYTMGLTGTLIGGKAVDLHAPLWRMAPDLLRNRGFDLSALRGGKVGPIGRNAMSFVRKYGVMERQVHRNEVDDLRGVRRGACGRRKEYKTADNPKPGISPDLYNHFLIGRAVFMSLAELGPALPTMERVLVACKPTKTLRDEYTRIDLALKQAIEERVGGEGKGPPVLVTIRISALDSYLDRPWGWKTICAPTFDENGIKNGYEAVVQPKDLGENHEDDKDRKIVEQCKSELAQGRKCAIYVSFTGEHDVRPKIIAMLKREGIRAVGMPDTVKPEAREDWIAKHIHEIDVLVVHPKRVMTGLDLVQFPSLMWYQVGYSTHVLRQASARARRPTQTQACKVFFFYYEGTIQEQALALMGEKEAASQALEGTFDVAALKNMMNGGQNDDIMAALANRLGSRGSAKAAWAKMQQAERDAEALYADGATEAELINETLPPLPLPFTPLPRGRHKDVKGQEMLFDLFAADESKPTEDTELALLEAYA